jgi:hypothetical protein
LAKLIFLTKKIFEKKIRQNNYKIKNNLKMNFLKYYLIEPKKHYSRSLLTNLYPKPETLNPYTPKSLNP